MPEHFSTPLFFAQKYFGLDAQLIPFPSGTGHMITSLRSKEIDIGIGLTEGWIAGLGNEKDEEKEKSYRIVGTYVESPLCKWKFIVLTFLSLTHPCCIHYPISFLISRKLLSNMKGCLQ